MLEYHSEKHDVFKCREKLTRELEEVFALAEQKRSPQAKPDSPNHEKPRMNFTKAIELVKYRYDIDS